MPKPCRGSRCGEPDYIFLRLKTPPTSFYSLDYLDDMDFSNWPQWNLADNPYRYRRW